MASDAKSVFLIGMMASGKSTIGRALAKKLGWDYYDVDKYVEEKTGVTVAEIFETEGEIGFRRRETEAMAYLTSLPRVVVSMGGGAPMFEVNRKLLARGLVIQLVVTVSDVIERTEHDRSRPLLSGSDKINRVRQILLDRGPTYDAVSDIRISTTRKNPNLILEELFLKKEFANFLKGAVHD